MTSEEAAGTEKVFEVGQGSQLSVSNVSGRINVSARPEPLIRVRATRAGRNKGDVSQIDIRQDGNKVSVQTKAGQFGLMNFGRLSRVDYDIEVPIDCSVQLNAVSADISVDGCRSSVSVQTVSGDTNLRDVAGEITMTTRER